MAEQEQDRTEEPTPYRLQEARKKGQVPRSTDLGSAIVMVAFCFAFSAAAGNVALALSQALRRSILLAGNSPELGKALVHWVGAAFDPAWQALTPVLLAVLVAAVAGNVLQTGGVFTTHPIKPDFTRLNPAQAMKRLFGLKTLWELGKLVVKTALLCALAWYALHRLGVVVSANALVSPMELPRSLHRVFVSVSIWIVGILLAVACADLLFSRKEFVRKLRMSRRDIKDEIKKREGDPSVKSKRRKLVSELLKRSRSIQRVADADVVMTNPTHLAVALRYRPKTMLAPVVLAKGTDRAAARMREYAARHRVPVLQSPKLARALFKQCGIDQPVPASLFTQLAPVYRWLMARDRSRFL
ncbi:flagellar biosynthesis protein FlhB [Oleiagrimonas citrea]|uniref:Flagellar biosynthetic protein FlhB n=1 Tax=Oleiagrimonas citrea TaxID=1665687 RepID=A0A846ZMC4_9GAMM|nr:EscU/YscU/HrcU family type III secretion system export apparatus switch protein [Oleiagrimonas citrea]NKZ39012.1 EscU/YscU/HrcU family type III secretion system export apparatus switch protein [Oleiagrimonas citrea]